MGLCSKVVAIKCRFSTHVKGTILQYGVFASRLHDAIIPFTYSSSTFNHLSGFFACIARSLCLITFIVSLKTQFPDLVGLAPCEDLNETNFLSLTIRSKYYARYRASIHTPQFTLKVAFEMMEFVVQCLYNAASVATGFGAVVSVPIVANQHLPWLPPQIAHKLPKNETSRTSHIIAAPEMTTVYTKSVSYITQTTLFGIDRTTTVHNVAPTVPASHPAVTIIKSPYDNTCKDYLTNLYPKIMILSIIIGIALCLLHMYNHRRMRSHQEQQPGIDDLHLDIVSTQDAFDAPTQTEPTYQDERKPGAIPGFSLRQSQTL